ncbi:MAG: hypothetical protein AB7V45_01555 [Candidatus Krumholzibacteriia bacterium]
MNSQARILAVICLLILGAAAGALAADLPAERWDHPAEATADCQIGNLNDAVGISGPELFTGNETFAYLVNPQDQCGCTEGGFTVETIYQLLYFEPQQVPALLQVVPRLLAVNLDPTTECMFPGPEVCLGQPVTILVEEPGYQLVTVPMAQCPLQWFDQPYFLSLGYEGGSPAFLAIDDQPAPCVEYVDRGFGWEDMFLIPDKTGGGKHILFGDVVCGALSVDNETGSWGSIKSLYR